jgi:putative transposase
MRRTQVAVFVHFVWATWDRLPLLTGEVERGVYRTIGAKCQELDAEMVALGGIEDHIHLLVCFPATLTIAELVRSIKGASSHLVTHQISVPGEFFKWQGAYGAFSVSPQQLEQVRNYIMHQREHHALGSLVQEWEHWPDK